MKHQEGFFNGVRDHRIYYQYWLPETEPKAVLLVVHGLAEHGGRYMNLVNHFIPLGYAVYAADHLGHGRSEGARVYVERFADYTDTLSSFREMIRGWQNEKPVFLVGHSMGGLIGALYLLSHQNELAGAVLSAPAVKAPDDISPVTIFAAKVLSALMPRLGLIQVEAEGVSRDPAVVKAYEDRSPCLPGDDYGAAGCGNDQDDEAGRRRGVPDQPSALDPPGGADRLVHPSGAQMLHDGVASIDRKIILYEGFYHEVFNEPEHGRVLRDVEIWLEAHTG